VDTPNGDWYYMGFLDAYPNGRIPVLAPLTWSDGWPNLVTDNNGGWGQSYPVPAIDTDKTVTPVGPFSDTFDGENLHPEWEWNHNPDNEAWSLGEGGLTLSTTTITTNLHAARNTLTHRILGPKSSGTFRLNLGNLAAGDIAGVAILRDESAYIGARKESDGNVTLINVNGIKMENSNGWQTVSEGEVADSTIEGLEGVASGEQDLWLRITADVTPNFNGPAGQNTAQLAYSTDGVSFQQLGPDFDIHTRWQFFMSHRFGVFNFATESLGGAVIVKGFDLQLAQ
jgi:beta-xylosidase